MAHTPADASADGTGRTGSLPSFLGLPTPAVAVIDGDGTVLVWTEGARRLLGHSRDEMVGRPAEHLLTAPSRDEDADGGAPPTDPHDPVWKELVRTREHWSGEVDVRHHDGRAVRVNLEVAPLAGMAGQTCWFLAATDTPGGPERRTASGSAVQTLLDHSPLAVAVWDTELRCVWLNQTSSRAVGMTRESGEAGLSIQEALEGFDIAAMEPVMRRVLETGEPVVDHEVRWQSPAGGSERVFSSSIFRLDLPDGTPLGVSTVSMDITQSWARERLALLGRAAKRVGSTLDVMTTAQELAEVAVPALADYCTVDLEESMMPGAEPLWRVPAVEGFVPALRRAGVASVREGAPESPFPRGGTVFVPPSSPFMEVLHGNTSHFEPVMETGPGSWLDRDRARARRIEETGMHSMMMVPLRARGTVLGLAVFIRTTTPAPFTPDDLLLAEELALQASLSLDNARRYTRERTAALALQRALLPRNLSGGAGVDLASRYLPSDRHEGVGGDWLDAIRLPGDRVALVIGDVVGHGINAAATMGRMRTAVHTLAALDQPPAELLSHLDELALTLSEDTGSDATVPPIMGATCIYAVYDPNTRICSLARAGHPPPVIVAPDGRVTVPDLPVGVPIGLGLASYQSVELELPEDSVIVFFTDGLIETRSVDIDVGIDRLTAALGRPWADLDELCSEVISTMTSARPEDDIALLVARTRTLQPADVLRPERVRVG